MNPKLNTLGLLVLACGLACTASAQSATSGDGADADRPLRGPAVRQADPDAQNARPMREGRPGRAGESGAFTRGAPRLGEGAEPMTPEQREARQAAMRERAEKMHAKLIKLYDADGDGKLSESERETARDELLGMLQALGAPTADRARPAPERAQGRDQEQAGEDGAVRPQQRFDGQPGGRFQRGEGRPEGMRGQGRAREAIRNMTPEQRQRLRLRWIDTNRDGVIDAQELIAGIELIRSGDRRADFNGDGVVDEADIAALTELARRNQ